MPIKKKILLFEEYKDKFFEVPAEDKFIFK